MVSSWVKTSVGLLLVASASVPAAARAPEIPLPHVYVTPTVGVWRWDEQAFAPGEVADRTRPVYGIRAGFARFEALSVELVVLSGTNRPADAPEGEREIRLTQAELSLVVNFRSLVNARVYPFVSLGLGGSFPGGGVEVSGTPVFEDAHLNYHLGGGLKGDVSSRFTARLGIRDTFYNDSYEVSGQAFQNTLDTVEVSLGLDYRIPLGGGGRGGDRLR